MICFLILNPIFFYLQQIKDELCEVVAEMEGLDSQEDCKHSNKNKQMSIGRKKFNMDPKKGKCYFILGYYQCLPNHILRYRTSYTHCFQSVYKINLNNK